MGVRLFKPLQLNVTFVPGVRTETPVCLGKEDSKIGK